MDFTTQAEEIRTTDDLGRLSTAAHTIAGTPLGTVSYGYNANGSLASVETSWAGGYTLHRGMTGLVDEVRDSSTSALLASIDGRDALGRVTHATGPDGTETSRAYDALGRTTWSAIQSGTTLDDRQYTHDLLGRVEQVDHVDADGAWTQYFDYESPGRLIGDKRMTGSVVTSQVVYAWDAAGNRTSVTRDGVTVVSTYLPGDRLSAVGWTWSEERHASQRACAATTTALDGTLAGPPARVPARRGGVDALSGSTVSPLYTFWRSAAGEPVATEDGDGLHREVWGNPGADLPLAGDGPEGDWPWIAVDGVVLGQLRGGVALGAASDPLGSIAYYDGALAGVPEAFGEGSGVSDVRHGWAGMETLPGTPYQLAASGRAVQNLSTPAVVVNTSCMTDRPSRLCIERAAESGGLLRAVDLAVPLYALAQAEKAGVVERLAPGVYIGAHIAQHTLAEAAAWTVRHPEAVGCLLTAAVYHGLTDAFEQGTWLLVPVGTSPPRSRTSAVRVVQVAPRLVEREHDDELGIEAVTVHGVRVRVTGPDRTVLDLWRYPQLVAGEHALGALRKRVSDPRFRIPAFVRLARELDVWTRIEPVLQGMTA